jgi:hypothetical protein
MLRLSGSSLQRDALEVAIDFGDASALPELRAAVAEARRRRRVAHARSTRGARGIRRRRRC